MIALRMRGLPPALWISASLCLWPLVFCGYEIVARHRHIESSLLLLSGGVALMPWLSRLIARLTYRAACDDVALHVAGEALPWNAITRVTEHRSWRRTTMILERGRTTRIELVIRDLFAGRLEPIDQLSRRLPRS